MAEHWIVTALKKRFVAGAARGYRSTEDYGKYVNNVENDKKDTKDEPEEEKKKDMVTRAIELGQRIMNINKKKTNPTATTAIRG